MQSDLCMHLFLVAGGPWFLFSKVLYVVIFFSKKKVNIPGTDF
jgi:hypothetical protein